MKRPAVVSDLGSSRQFLQLEPFRLRETVRWLESGLPVELDFVVERHVPRAAVSLERLDVIQPWLDAGQAELFFQNPRARPLGMFEVVQLIVGKEPSALVVVLSHVAVSDE